MSLLIAIILMGSVNIVICNHIDHYYSKDCAPPYGYWYTHGNVTTTPYGPEYYPIRPIEKCCPACDKCVHIGGHCKLNWIPYLYPEWCDFTTQPECRDYSCTCCIKCGDDKCSPCTETWGNCRKECRTGELEDTQNKCSFYNNGTDGCKCCKRCEATSECIDAYGFCVTDKDDCPYGTYASRGCCGGCYCCKPVCEPVHGSVCAYTPGSYCVHIDVDYCEPGYYLSPNECSKIVTHGGLRKEVACNCCVPK